MTRNLEAGETVPKVPGWLPNSFWTGVVGPDGRGGQAAQDRLCMLSHSLLLFWLPPHSGGFAANLGGQVVPEKSVRYLASRFRR